MRAVREVQPGNTHAASNQLLQGVHVLTRRPCMRAWKVKTISHVRLVPSRQRTDGTHDAGVANGVRQGKNVQLAEQFEVRVG